MYIKKYDHKSYRTFNTIHIYKIRDVVCPYVFGNQKEFASSITKKTCLKWSALALNRNKNKAYCKCPFFSEQGLYKLRNYIEDQ